MAKWERRNLGEELAADAVRLVSVDDESIGHAAEDLDLTAGALRGWAERAEVDETEGDSGALSPGPDGHVHLRLRS